MSFCVNYTVFTPRTTNVSLLKWIVGSVGERDWYECLLVQCRCEPAAVESPVYCGELRFKSSTLQEEGQHIHSICSCRAASKESL